jgi:hypothetical protein
MVDLHTGDSFLNGCLTLVGCLLGILPYSIRVLLTAWWISFIMATWRGSLAWRMPYLGGVLCIMEEGIRP